MESPLNKKIQRGENRKAASPKKAAVYTSLREKVLALVQESNANVREERRVTPRAALTVMDRALASLSSLGIESREAGALREVSIFISTAAKTFNTNNTKHTDLLIQGHPLSALNASLTPAEYREKYATWLAADSAVNENVRSLVASAHAAKPGSVERDHAFSRLLMTKKFVPGYFKIDVLEAITAAFGSGNSSAARRARVALQWRDRKGRWVEMGRGVNFRFRLPDGSIQVGNGTYVGAGGDSRVENTANGPSLVAGSGLIEVSGVPGLQPGLYVINSNNASVYQARIPGYAAPEKPSFKDQLDADIPSLEDLNATRKELPIGWKDEGAFYGSDDNYAVIPRNGQPHLVVRKNAEGRLSGDTIAQVRNWAEVNAAIEKDQPAFDKEIARIEEKATEGQLPLGRIPGATAEDVISAQDLLKMQEQRTRENEAIDAGKPAPQPLGNKDLNGNTVPDGWVRSPNDDNLYTREMPLRDGGTYPIIARLQGDGKYIAGTDSGWIPEPGTDGRGPSRKFDTLDAVNEDGVPGLVEYLNGTFTKNNPIEYTPQQMTSERKPGIATQGETRDENGIKVPADSETVAMEQNGDAVVVRMPDGSLVQYDTEGPEGVPYTEKQKQKFISDIKNDETIWFDEEGRRNWKALLDKEPQEMVSERKPGKATEGERPYGMELDFGDPEKAAEETGLSPNASNEEIVQAWFDKFIKPAAPSAVLDSTGEGYDGITAKISAADEKDLLEAFRVYSGQDNATMEDLQDGSSPYTPEQSSQRKPGKATEGESLGKEIYERRITTGDSLDKVAEDLGLTRIEVRRLESEYARQNPDAANNARDVQDVNKALDFLDKHMDDKGTTEDAAMGISEAQDHLKEAKKDLENGDIKSAISSLEDAFNLMDGIENASDGIFPNGENSAEAVDVVDKLIARLQEADTSQTSERKPGTATQDENQPFDVSVAQKFLDERFAGSDIEIVRTTREGRNSYIILNIPDNELQDFKDNSGFDDFENKDNFTKLPDGTYKLYTDFSELNANLSSPVTGDGPGEPPTPPTGGTPPKTPTPSQPSTPGLFNNFDVPNGAFQLRTVDYEPEGRVDEASTNFTDDPKKLATRFTPQDLVSALSEALVGTSDDAAIAEILNANVDDAGDIPGAEDMNGVDIPRANMGQPSGAGRLEFNAGEEYVPMEALYNAVWEAGLDPNRVVANIYDSVNGNNNNLNRLIEAQGGVRSPEEAKLVDDITAEIRQIKSASPDSVSSANKKDKPLPEEDPLPGQLIENVPIDFENPDYYIPDSNAYIPSQPTVDENGFTDNPEILSRDYETADLIDQMIAGITDGSGAALLSFDDITVEVPVEALRDAIQLQDINTNDILLELKKESNDMSEPDVKSESPALQGHSQMIKDLIEQTGNTVDDETADKIRDAINEKGLLDWSEADKPEIIEAILEVAGPGILEQAPTPAAERRFPPTTGERQAIETPANPPAPRGPFGDSEGLNKASALVRSTFSRGFNEENKIAGIYENEYNGEGMIVVSLGDDADPIIFKWDQRNGAASFVGSQSADWYTSERGTQLGWRAATGEEQAALRALVGDAEQPAETLTTTTPRYEQSIDFTEINTQQQFINWLEENGLQNDIKFRSIRPDGDNSEVSFEFINDTSEVRDRFARAYNDSASWDELTTDLGGDISREIPAEESAPVAEQPATEPSVPALAYPGPENRGYHPDNTTLDRAGKVMGKGTRIRASRDGRTGTVIAVQNIDNRSGERIPYVRVRFDDGTIAVRSALKVRATGDATQGVPQGAPAATPSIATNVGERLDAPVVNPGKVATDGSIAGVSNLGELPQELQGLENPNAVQTDFAAWGDRAGEIAFAGRNRVSLDNLRKLNVEYALATLAARNATGEDRANKLAEAEVIKERLQLAISDTFGARDGVTFGASKYTIANNRGVNGTVNAADEAGITKEHAPMQFYSSMTIKDADGRSVGTVNRTLSYVSRGDGTPGYWKVKNDYMGIENTRDKKSGFATAYNRYMEDWYIANGVKEIHVQAAGGGSYQGAFVWALNGFNWETPGSAENDLSWRLQRMRREANTDQERAAIDRLKQRTDQAKIPGGGVDLDKAPTPMELALVGWYPGATTWLGKKFMSENTGWMGVKRLDPVAKEQVQAINYDQIRRARLRIKEKLNRPGVSREFVLKANSDEFLANNQTLTPYIEEIRSAFQNNTSLATLSPAAKTALSRWVGDQIMAGDSRTLPLTDAFRLRTALDAEAAADNPRAGQTDFGVGNLLASADFEDISRNRLPGFTVRRLGTEESGYNDTYLVKHTDSGQIFYVKKDELAKQYRIDPLRAEIEAGMLTRALGFQGMYETRANIKDTSGEVLVMQQAGSSLPLASEPQTLSNVFENGGIQGPDGMVPVTRSTLLDSLRTPEDAIRIALLDLLINNQDRHNGNVLLAVDGTDPSRLRMLPIDHSLAQMAPSDTFNFEQVLSTYDNIYSNTIPVLLQRMGQDALVQAFRNEADKLVASLRSDAFSPSGNELRIIIDRYGSLNAYRDAIEARTAELLTPGTRNFEQFKDVLTASYWR